MKYVIITGADGGMGRAAVKEFIKEGYGVIALDVREYSGEVPVLLSVRCDLTDTASVEEAYARVCELTDKIDLIVHLVGIYTLDSLVEAPERDLRRAFDINFFGAANVNRIFLPLLARGSRIIVTTSELAALDPLPFTGIYAITKGTLDKYAYSLRMEFQLLGIDVTVLRAGATSTDMLGVSTAALDRFCENTELYSCNAARFKKIVNSVESRSISPERVSKKLSKIAGKRRTRFAYSINRNPLLLLLDALPRAWRFKIIKRILK
ncbi:MAG: SDR family NAD(P)-dependent oxidoreductase [Clostridia bacterium]|nr:SDR family NAD(P)-dependent oxidoreductase [Clostridia bacterium]